VTGELPEHSRGAGRIRLGVGLVIVSWLPVAQLTIRFSGASGTHANDIRVVIWTIQILVGLAGVAIAGKETIALVKSVGWKALPRAVWRLLRSPRDRVGADETRDA
jgi:hypothetical protein